MKKRIWTISLIVFLNIFGFITSISLNACQQSKIDCNALPTTYSTYEEALAAIKSASFKIEEKINTDISSWIRGASFYSCDGNTGFLIIATDSKDYSYEGVPVSVWERFKNADSFGKEYNLSIKGKYTMKVEGK